MLSGLISEFLESNFLAKETSELSRLNSQLKGAVNLNQATLTQLQTEIESHHRAIDAAADRRRQITAELEALGADKSALWREVATLRDRHGAAVVALSEVENAAEQAKAQAREFVSERQSIAARMATEAADKAETVDGLNKELDRLTAALTQAETRFSEKQAGLLQTYDTALGQHRAKLESLEIAAIERGEALDLEIQNRQNRIVQLEQEYSELKGQIIAEAEREIELQRRAFELERQSVINELERERIQVHRELTTAQETVLEKYRPMIEDPLLQEIQALQIEVGRVHKKLAAKEGKPFEWSPEQIKDLLVRELEDGSLRPNHLRIAGESESGKSHLVNQLISEGLNHFGLNCDFELFDPFPSDTRWAMAPTIADDSEAVLARLNHWREFCEAENTVKRDRPLVIICDESDEMVRQYKEKMVDCIKAIWKRGRHLNVILWLLGQNGNVAQLKPLDWSDLKNAGSAYLNQVGFDYLKNGLKGRNTAALLGELEAIAEKHSYYALIHMKGKPRPYAVAIPKQLFPAAATAPSATPGATPEPALKCPKCHSVNVKKAGFVNGRQRVKCHTCDKQSFAEEG
jgi:hypothetical protein